MTASMKLNMKITMAALVGLMWLLMAAESTPNTAINEWQCNKNTYSSTDPFAGNVEYVLSALVSVTPNSGYDYYTQSPSPSSVCYGYATCAASLSYNDCAACLSAARYAVKDICAAKIGGAVEMVDCTIRYENYSF